MFEGEKTVVFWIGLIIVGVAAVVLFGVLWMIVIWNGAADRLGLPYQAANVGGFIVILIGFYIMKSGVKKKEDEERNPAKPIQYYATLCML